MFGNPNEHLTKKAESTIYDLLKICEDLNLQDVILIGCSGDVQLKEKTKPTVIAPVKRTSFLGSAFAMLPGGRRLPAFLVFKKHTELKGLNFTQLRKIKQAS